MIYTLQLHSTSTHSMQINEYCSKTSAHIRDYNVMNCHVFTVHSKFPPLLEQNHFVIEVLVAEFRLKINKFSLEVDEFLAISKMALTILLQFCTMYL